MYICLGKTWAKIPLLHQNCIIKILWKQVFKQTIEETEEKSEITVISNKYIDTFDDLVDNLDTKFLNWPESQDCLRAIDKRTCNMLKSKSGLPTLLKENCKDENILVMSVKLVLNVQNFQVH